MLFGMFFFEKGRVDYWLSQSAGFGLPAHLTRFYVQGVEEVALFFPWKIEII